jgi:EmrB/QacA subfamily drug resistance transporter
MRRPTTAVLVALLVAGTGFMELLDTTIITTALPSMAESFHVHPIDLNLGITAYVIMLAAGIPLSGWAAERFGAKTIFALAILIFTLASGLCGVSQGLWSFFAARILQGLGGAMMVPVGRLVVLRVTPRAELMRATALITWPALVAPIIGPGLGGFLTGYASWRWIFFINLPIGAVALLIALLLVSNERQAAKPLDRVGAVLSALAAICIVYGTSLLGSSSGGLVLSLGLVLAGLAGAAATVWHARRHPHPLIEFSALRSQSFRPSVRGGSVIRMAINAVPFLMPLMLQLGFGRSPVVAGSLLLVLFVGNLGIKPFTTPIMRRFGFRTVLIINGSLLAATMLAAGLLTATSPAWFLLPLLLISGMTRSTQFTALNTLAFAEIPPQGMTSANTLFNLAQQVTFGLGVAVGAVLLRLGGWLLGAGMTAVAVFHFAFFGIGLLCLAGLADFIALPRNAGAEVSGHGKRI